MDTLRRATSSPTQLTPAPVAEAPLVGVHFHSEEVYGLLPGEQRCFPEASAGACLLGTVLDCCCGSCLQVQRASGWIQNICAQHQHEQIPVCETRPLRDAAMCDECVCCCDTRLGVAWAWGMRPWSLQPAWLRAIAAVQQVLCLLTALSLLLSLLLVAQLQSAIDLHNSKEGKFANNANSPARTGTEEAVQPVQDHFALVTVWLLAAGCMLCFVSAAVHAGWHCLPVRERYHAMRSGVQLVYPSQRGTVCKQRVSCGMHALWCLPLLMAVCSPLLGLLQSSSTSGLWGSTSATSLIEQQRQVLATLVDTSDTGFQRFVVGILLAATCSAVANWLAVFFVASVLSGMYILTGSSMLCAKEEPTLWVQQQSTLHAWGARAAVAEWAGLQMAQGWHTLPSTSMAFATPEPRDSGRTASPWSLPATSPEAALAMQLSPRRRPLGFQSSSSVLPSSATENTMGESVDIAHAHGQAYAASNTTRRVGTIANAADSSQGAGASASEAAWSGATAPPLYTLHHFDANWPSPRQAGPHAVPMAWPVDISSMQLCIHGGHDAAGVHSDAGGQDQVPAQH